MGLGFLSKIVWGINSKKLLKLLAERGSVYKLRLVQEIKFLNNLNYKTKIKQ